MSAQKCVVEGCNLEYDVVCSFSFYNVNTSAENDNERQEWISGAMKEEGECLWRHVSLHLCGYHFELDSQGLWIDSPMLPELLTPQKPAVEPIIPTEEEKAASELVKVEHNYSAEPSAGDPEPISRLNVRQLVDTLGYLSMKNLQRKQLWVVKVETDKAEASIAQSEQVITKMQEAKVIEIIPQDSSNTTAAEDTPNASQSEEIQTMEDPNNFIYEIAEEQEITMDEVEEIPVAGNQEWMVNIIPDEPKARYAFVKQPNTGKKKRHFTADMNEVTLYQQSDFDNCYILPDADPSLGVEITTSYEPENYIVEEYQHLVLDERPKKRAKKDGDSSVKRKKKMVSVREQVKQIKSEMEDDWGMDGNMSYDQDDSDDFDPKKGRARRKNKKYDYDFVT